MNFDSNFACSMRVLLLRMAGAQASGTPSLKQVTNQLTCWFCLKKTYCQYCDQIQGPGKTLFDNILLLMPGKMSDKSTGDVAADGYHKYKVGTRLQAFNSGHFGGLCMAELRW